MKQLFSRQALSGLPAVLLFLAMLMSPKAVFEGAQSGLLLWFQIIFPTLFPFMLVTGLMMAGGGLQMVSRVFGRLFSAVFSTSSNGAFAVMAGFLCGYPMGAKVSADLVRTGKISQDEGAYLLSFCNNTSPVFIMNFIVWKTLGREDLLLPTVAVLILVPVSLSFLFRRFYLKGRRSFPDTVKKDRGRKERFSFSVMDSCLSDSFEGIVKVGLYIIFFSVMLCLLTEISSNNPLVYTLMTTLEITNGIVMINRAVLDLSISYPLILGLTSFGGICAAAQTRSMLGGTGLPMLPYITQKLTAAAAASLAGIIIMRIY